MSDVKTRYMNSTNIVIRLNIFFIRVSYETTTSTADRYRWLVVTTDFVMKTKLSLVRVGAAVVHGIYYVLRWDWMVWIRSRR